MSNGKTVTWNSNDKDIGAGLILIGRGLASLQKEHAEILDALKGVVGLVQLVRSRDDCPIGIAQALSDHYRLDDAFEAIRKAEEASK